PATQGDTQPDLVAQQLALHGVAAPSEAAELIRAWIAQALQDGAPPGWQGKLPGAVALGLDLYERFNREFSDFFLAAGCPGPGYVRRALRRAFQTVDDRLTEVVLERIRGRRGHLLGSFFRKHQPAPFAPTPCDDRLLKNYLKRVARVESWHIPADELPGR